MSVPTMDQRSMESRAYRDTPVRLREEEKSAEFLAGGSIVETIGGAATVVLAILGLSGSLPAYLTYLASVTAIVLGAALLFEGATVAARYSRLVREISGTTSPAAELGGGMMAELLGGTAGIALGILALLGIYPVILLSVAAIVFGGSLMFACGSTWGMNSLIVERAYASHEGVRQVATHAVSASNAMQMLAGVAATVLGIVALAGTSPLDLTMVAFLITGCAVAFSGAAVSGKMFAMLSR